MPNSLFQWVLQAWRLRQPVDNTNSRVIMKRFLLLIAMAMTIALSYAQGKLDCEGVSLKLAYEF